MRPRGRRLPPRLVDQLRSLSPDLTQILLDHIHGLAPDLGKSIPRLLLFSLPSLIKKAVTIVASFI